MAITQDVTTVTPTVYTPPVYRKLAAQNLYFNIYSDTKMIVVNTTSGKELISNEGFPTGRFSLIADTESSDQTEYETARDAAKTAIDAV